MATEDRCTTAVGGGPRCAPLKRVETSELMRRASSHGKIARRMKSAYVLRIRFQYCRGDCVSSGPCVDFGEGATLGKAWVGIQLLFLRGLVFLIFNTFAAVRVPPVETLVERCRGLFKSGGADEGGGPLTFRIPVLNLNLSDAQAWVDAREEWKSTWQQRRVRILALATKKIGVRYCSWFPSCRQCFFIFMILLFFYHRP